MARHPNPNNKFTTISVDKKDKILLRTLARKVKETKNGIVYEKDADIFKRVIQDYMSRHITTTNDEPKPTYPSSALNNIPRKSQPGSRV